MIEAAAVGLLHKTMIVLTLCDNCDIDLRKSKWRNTQIFESTSKSWESGFLCIRCSSKTPKQLDRFLKKLDLPKKSVQKEKRISHKCRNAAHKQCGNTRKENSSMIECLCRCHQK